MSDAGDLGTDRPFDSFMSGGAKALLFCAAFSVAAHGLVLTLRFPALQTKQATQGVVAGTQAVRMRVTPAPPVLAASQAGDREKSSTVQPDAIAPRGRPARTLEPRPSPAPHHAVKAENASISTEAANPESEAPALAMAASQAAAFGPDDYIPRPLLSVPPVAMTPIILTPPMEERASGRYVGILSLFIDEHGQVQRVLADEPMLPASFEQVAREAFMGAKFAPGQKDGGAVKSRLRVEVVFDNTTMLGN